MPPVVPMSPEPPLPVSPPPLHRSNRSRDHHRDRDAQAVAIKERRKAKATALMKAGGGSGRAEGEPAAMVTPKKKNTEQQTPPSSSGHDVNAYSTTSYSYPADGEDDLSITPISDRPETTRSLLQAASPRIDNTGETPRSGLRSQKFAHASALVKKQRNHRARVGGKKGGSSKVAMTPRKDGGRSTNGGKDEREEETADTPATRSISSTEEAEDMETPPQRESLGPAKAYNRFFPPKPAETHDAFGIERVLSVEHLDTGDVEIYPEERYYANNDADGTFAAHQWNIIADLAKKEWDVGTGDNTRYNGTGYDGDGADDDDADISVASLPSVLDRSEIFHESAAQAIVSLLGPNHKTGGGANMDECDDLLDDASTSFSAISGVSCASSRFGSANNSGMWDTTSQFSDVRGNAPVPLLSAETEVIVESIPDRMIQPTRQLAELVAVIHSMEGAADSAPGQEQQEQVARSERGYMTRRKNACGALKVLAAKEKNRVSICWTVGVLSSITSVLSDSAFDYVDKSTYDAFIEARKRAIAALMSMTIAPQNRVLIFHSPGLVHGLVGTMAEDEGESRQGCCAILTYLSKTVENRLLMAQAPGLVDAMVNIIRPPEKEDVEEEKGGENGEEKQGKQGTFGEYLKAFSASSQEDTATVPSDEDTPVTRTLSSDTLEDAAPAGGGVAAARSKGGDDNSGVVDYDGDPNQFLHGARLNVYATLMNLVKEKDNVHHFARNPDLTSVLIDISNIHGSPSHVRSLAILAHLTRHKDNTKHMSFRLRHLLPTLVRATKSGSADSRKHAAQAIQNLSADRHCRQEVANTHDLIESLCRLTLKDPEVLTRQAAMGALKNLTDEPANLIPMTNARDCFATLILVSHGSGGNAAEDDGVVTDLMQYMAKDALATLSHWLRKVATKATAPGGGRGRKKAKLYVPSVEAVGFQQWE